MKQPFNKKWTDFIIFRYPKLLCVTLSTWWASKSRITKFSGYQKDNGLFHPLPVCFLKNT
ncbi:hypothetical protein ABE28_013975 [Peribacillus muralis]|uniref:Uncharacterized protein n=1 Tax=Peribacillus muralis TaxID=264697 RepID=A0A1B3XQF8_9BACI|nr:hypothetical protein ABE28_013975 [Peribacillus muralis]